MKAQSKSVGRKNNAVVELSQREVTLQGWIKAATKLSVCESSQVSLVISFKNVKYLCSAVLSSLMEARVQLRNNGLNLVLQIDTLELAELLDLIHFDSIFEVQYSKAA
jgi:anti-anti-sigma regulatory factor